MCVLAARQESTGGVLAGVLLVALPPWIIAAVGTALMLRGV
ncbi:hypothetical protein [Frankia sp. AgKG'84/4]|nr:hypothetical protein [Frankia sp. AgKG'84/4]